MLQIGETAPDFELISDEGKSTKLSDYRGKRLVLFFYPKAFTGGCTKQACGMRDNYSEFEAHGATVLGISPDDPETLAKWRKAENLPFNLLSDPDHVVADQYHAWGEKSMYGKKYMGVIRSHFIIDAEGNFEDVQIKISPAKSIDRALKSIVG
ncbi:MAG: thioredoxin-dependent thiol peroxidase [Ardenticatenaceae bacterium]|nr:thioredoxin-dependent thiol peroxidase [Ardenticatenaceae bacterium]